MSKTTRVSRWGQSIGGGSRPEKSKLARPFDGPYRVIKIMENNAEVHPIGKPDKTSPWLNVELVRLCPAKIKELSIRGKGRPRRNKIRE